MPINPLYQFIEPGAADIDDRNKVLSFLQQDAQRTGMPLNYQRELGNAQEQMNVLDQARPQLNMGQAPMPMPPRPRPQVPMQQIRGAQLPMSPMEAPELQSPEAPEPKDIQGISGLASQEEVPMTMPANAGGKIEVPPTASIANEPIEQLPSAGVTMERQVPDRFAQTTMAQMGQKAGWDPRALYAALAQFSGEFGNLYGKATPSSAQPYYEQMMDAEQKAQAAAQKAREAALDRDMREREMQMRYAPKPVDPQAALKLELVKAQADSLKNRMRVDQELNDPMSERSKALKQAYEVATGKKLPEGISGAEVKQIIPRTMTSPAEERAWREQEAEKQRQFQAQQNALNRGAALQRQQTAIEARPAKPGEVREGQTLVPGWQQTVNVPLERGELVQFRKRTAKVPGIIRKINQLRALIQKYGPVENTVGQAGQDMASLANDIKLDLKGPEFKELGVLAGPDMAILEALVPNTEPGFNLNTVRSASSVNANLSNLANRLEADLDDAARSIGFSRAAQEQTQPQQTGPRGRTLWKP